MPFEKAVGTPKQSEKISVKPRVMQFPLEHKQFPEV